MSEECLFCKIAAKTLPATIVHEDEQCLVFEDIFPKAPVHLLVIPKQHIDSISQLSLENQGLMGHLVRVAAELAKGRQLSEKGYRLVINTGVDAGQTVPHLHLHLLGGHSLGNMG
jgi:histidine triad (HIT) family protein